MKFRLHLYVLPLMFLMITLYFAFHLVQGERGISQLAKINSEIAKGEAILETTNQEKTRLEKQIQALSPTLVQNDMLDEVARQQFGVIEETEYVIYE